jgi:hypothetical protein
LGGPRGADVVYRRWIAFMAIGSLLSAAILLWIDRKYETGIALGGLDAALWIVGIGCVREYLLMRRADERPEDQE